MMLCTSIMQLPSTQQEFVCVVKKKPICMGNLPLTKFVWMCLMSSNHLGFINLTTKHIVPLAYLGTRLNKTYWKTIDRELVIKEVMQGPRFLLLLL